MRYPEEILDEDCDDGTMPASVAELGQAVIGNRIVRTEKRELPGHWLTGEAFVIVLDNGSEVVLADTGDCCAYTELEEFLLHPDKVDHVIIGVGTTDGYATWHIYADLGDVLQLTVGWSAGNTGYYGYGFNIRVIDPAAKISEESA